MKKLVHVSLFVLATAMLVFFVGCKNDADPEPDPATAKTSNFVGVWKSTDGSTTATITADTFTTKVEEMPQSFSGGYTVSSDGRTLTTAEITLPAGMGGEKMKFSMKLKDGETDVINLPLSEEMGGNLVLVKTVTAEPNLDGTWAGKVVSVDTDATIVFASGKATLTVGEQNAESTAVEQDGNFFTITWQEENNFDMAESTGLVSASGKAWLDDGSVFTKQ